MGRIKRFIQTALTYLAGNIFSKLVTFFLIPLYTNKLNTAEYGDYDVISAIVTLLVSIAFFQIWDGMFRMSFDADDTEDKYSVISLCFKTYCIGIAVFSALFFIVSQVLSFSMVYLPYIFGIVYGLQFMYSFSTRIFLNNRLFVVSGAANTLTVAITNIVLILVFHMGVESLFIAHIAGALIQCLLIELRLHLIPKIIKYRFCFTRLKQILKFSIPLCVATVSYWLLSGFTKLSINRICGADDNGLFAIASSLSNMAVIAVNVFQFSWNETAYLMAHEDNRMAIYKKSLDLLFCTVWICCAAFCSVVNIIFPYYVGEAFQNSSVVVPYLMIGVSANAIAGFLGTLFMTEQKTGYIMISTLIASAVNIGLCGLATRHFGMIGSVIVLSASFALLMILRLVQIKKQIGIGISWTSLFSIIPVVVSVLLYKYSNDIGINALYLALLAVGYIILFQKITGISLKSIVQSRMKGRDI